MPRAERPEPDDELDEPPALKVGNLEPSADEDHHHGAGWLYLPDLASETGWSSHTVPRDPGPKRTRQLGFRRGSARRRHACSACGQ